MKVLEDKQIDQKIKRLAFQIAERNYKEKELCLVGINNNGLAFAKLIFDALPIDFQKKVKINNVRLNPANPLEYDIELDQDIQSFHKKNIIIVDDVCNSGRTLFYAIKPFLTVIPKKIQVAVLVDRKHKSYPIQINYVGLSLATTLQENIEVNLDNIKSAILN